MSTPFYDLASLVIQPSGVKAQKVYAQKPMTTDGQLTFSRSTAATRVGPDGLIEKVRTNLVLQSNTFSDAVWTKSNVTLTSGQVDPNGGTSATRAQYSGVSYILQVPSTSFATASIYIRATSGTASIRIADSNGSFATTYNLTETWQRISSSGSAMAGISIDSFIGGSWTAQDVIIAFAQFETGDIATNYIPTTTTAVSVGPVANLPRLNYPINSDGSVGCPRLLLEPQRQNVCLWSEQIDNAGWTKINAPTITTNIATAPDGYGGADGIQDTTGGNSKGIRQAFSVSANSTNTVSVFVKKETTQTNFGGLALTYTGGTAIKYAYGIVNPIAGTIVVSSDSVIGATSTKVEDYGDWWRFSLTATDNGSNTTLQIVYYATISTNGTSTGVGTGSVRTVWGFQLEIGAAYASSYVNTLGAAVTRLSDACYKAGISSLIGQTEGTLFCEISGESLQENSRYMSISDFADPNKRLTIYQSVPVTRLINVYCSAGATFNITYSPPAGTLKIAVGYKSGDYVLYVNGVNAATSTESAVVACSDLGLGVNEYLGTTNPPSVGYSQALLFPTRLTNAQLEELTTL